MYSSCDTDRVKASVTNPQPNHCVHYKCSFLFSFILMHNLFNSSPPNAQNVAIVC